MEKLKSLTAFLRNRNVLKAAGLKCNPKNIDSWAESGNPEYLGDAGADDGLYLFEHTYKAVIDLEEMAGDIRMLIALIIAWLKENDTERDKLDDERISWEGIPYDDDTSDIRIELWFWEKSYFGLAPAQSELAKITYKGADYILADEEIWIAENDDDPELIAVSIEND